MNVNNKVAVDRRTMLKAAAGIIGGTALAGCTETGLTYRQWGDVDEIVLAGVSDGWIGIEPDPIDGEVNPTVVLYEERDYKINLRNSDGEPHSLELWDGGGGLVDEYQTDISENEGMTRTMSIRATPSLTEYVCGVHPETEHGEISVRPEADTTVYDEEAAWTVSY